VIVDGQHRAMALLAIYRNLKDEWSDARRAPFKEYYSAWTPNYINQFNLTDINLPVILCTVPPLDEKYTGDFDLKKAARSIFLTLNKTARKVSTSRNILLDDNDLIAYFLRRCLSEVKQKDTRSPYSFRIWNVELDQFGDKLKIQSPIAITGVNHIHYIIEHALLDSGNVSGIAPRSGKFYKRTNLEDCIDRLGGRDILGSTVADTIRRDSFLADSAEKLGQRFDELYGKFVIAAFEKFALYEKHNQAAIELEKRIEALQDRQLRPILFEGQGIGRVFENYRENLHQNLKNNFFGTDVPEIQASARRLDATAKRITEAVNSFQTERAAFCLEDITDKRPIRIEGGAIHPKIVDWLNNTLFDNVLSTVAFQSALICGFFGEFEKASLRLAETLLDREAAFEEYIQQLNSFFVPKSVPKLKSMIQVFTGDVVGATAEEWRFSQSNQTFRNVVFRSEMQPDQWPKYRYLLLELWNPSHDALRMVVEEERLKCRDEVFSALYDHYRTTYCRDNRKLEDQGKRIKSRGAVGVG
jgi:DNA-sulfur modification-associated